jgi:hypothetical protein
MIGRCVKTEFVLAGISSCPEPSVFSKLEIASIDE